MLTINSGNQAAKTLVNVNRKSYDLASHFFGGLIDKYPGSAPRNLILSHILLVNPLFNPTPQPKGNSRGLMSVRIEDARAYDIEWEKLDDPETSIYVWSRALNDSAHFLYTNYPDNFTKLEDDYWKCTYLRQYLSGQMFDTLWLDAGINSLDVNTVYPKLKNEVENRRGNLLGVPVRELRKIVFLNVEYVLQFAQSRGKLHSREPGIEPVPSSRVIGKLFTRTNTVQNKSYANRSR